MKTQWSKRLSGYRTKKESENIGEMGEERGKGKKCRVKGENKEKH